MAVRKFKSVASCSQLSRLMLLYPEIKPDQNMGRLLAFIRFADEVGLSAKDWEQLYLFLSLRYE